MAAAAKQPVVLDPVGVGASPWRLAQVRQLLNGFSPAILRVNLGEARALLGDTGEEQGVDSPLPASREARLAAAGALARQYRTAVLLSGPEDLVSDGERAWCVTGGSNAMSRVTGTGCMLSVLCGVFAAAEPDAARRRGPGLRPLEGLAPAGRSALPADGAAAASAPPSWTPPAPSPPLTPPGRRRSRPVSAEGPPGSSRAGRLSLSRAPYSGPLSRAGRLSLSRAPYSRAFISNISSKDRM